MRFCCGSSGLQRKLSGMRVGSLLLGIFLWTAMAQQPTPMQMPPSEELKAATAPFEAARAQPDDLTEADNLALGVGVSRAGHACLALTPSLPSFVSQPDEILALARLCIFGQQFEPARQAAVQYLKRPATPKRETAMLLLVQAFLGLRDPSNAAQQVLSLERDYPYDTQIHYAEDQVLLAEGVMSDQQSDDVLKLCANQSKTSFAVLEQGQDLSGAGASVSPAILVSDAVRCIDMERALHDSSAAATFSRLQQALKLTAWKGTAELAPMQAAVARTAMVENRTPLSSISGKLVRANGPLTSQAVPLSHETSLLVPFTLWAPSTLSAVRSLPLTASWQATYLITSWSANTGGADQQTPELLASLRSFAQSLPAHASLLVVPEPVLEQFHADVFPAAIVIRDGVVKANLPLVGDTARRLTVLALGTPTPIPSKH